MPKKKLIETCMPLDVINKEAEREKNARTGIPSASAYLVIAPIYGSDPMHLMYFSCG